MLHSELRTKASVYPSFLARSKLALAQVLKSSAVLYEISPFLAATGNSEFQASLGKSRQVVGDRKS